MTIIRVSVERLEVIRAGEPKVVVCVRKQGLAFLVSGINILSFDSHESAEAFAQSVAEECDRVDASPTQLLGKALDDYSDSVQRTGWRRALKKLQQSKTPTKE